MAPQAIATLNGWGIPALGEEDQDSADFVEETDLWLWFMFPLVVFCLCYIKRNQLKPVPSNDPGCGWLWFL